MEYFIEELLEKYQLGSGHEAAQLQGKRDDHALISRTYSSEGSCFAWDWSHSLPSETFHPCGTYKFIDMCAPQLSVSPVLISFAWKLSLPTRLRFPALATVITARLLVRRYAEFTPSPLLGSRQHWSQYLGKLKRVDARKIKRRDVCFRTWK